MYQVLSPSIEIIDISKRSGHLSTQMMTYRTNLMDIIKNSCQQKQKSCDFNDHRTFLVRHEGLEPPTFAFVVRDSIQLS